MSKNKNRKIAARELASSRGISYQQACNLLAANASPRTASLPPIPRRSAVALGRLVSLSDPSRSLRTAWGDQHHAEALGLAAAEALAALSEAEMAAVVRVLSSLAGFSAQAGTADIRRAVPSEALWELRRMADDAPIRRDVEPTPGQLMASGMRLDRMWEFASHLQWRDVVRELRSGEVTEWVRLEDICAVMTRVGSFEALTHTFYPGGGGMDVVEVRPYGWGGWFELLASGGASPVFGKPRTLSLLAPDGWPAEWCYFYLELEPTRPTGAGGAAEGARREHLTELATGSFAHQSEWERGEGVRKATLMLEGAFATFCKGSVYNEIPDTYDGRHDTLGRQGFEAEIRSVVTRFEERGHFGDFTVRV